MAWCWCLWDLKPFCLGWLAEKLLLPLILAAIAYRFAVRQLKKKREIDFAEKQLTEFYAPMVGARAEIFNHTVFDQHLKNASQYVDGLRLRDLREREKQGRPDYSSEAAKKDKDYSASLDRFFEGLNERLLVERINAYREMRALFAKKMAYADPDTVKWYSYFYSFVEMWLVYREKGEKQFMTDDVRAALGSMISEEELQAFYRHLEERTALLKAEIRGETVERILAPDPPEVKQPRFFHDRRTDEELI